MEICHMMAKLFCASALLAAAGAANGAVFGVNTVDAGGIPGGALGSPITWTHATNGAAYNNASNAGDGPVSPTLIFNIPAAEFDSYIAIDPVGPSTGNSTSSSTDGYQALGPGNVIVPTGQTTVLSSGSLGGVWFNAAAGGGFVNSGAGDRLFITQLSLRPGSSGLDTAGLLVNIKDAGTANPNGSLGSLKFGLANATNNGGLWGQSYYLDTVVRTISNVNTNFNGGTSYAVFIVAVPAPGAAGIAGLAGLVAIRRRRA